MLPDLWPNLKQNHYKYLWWFALVEKSTITTCGDLHLWWNPPQKSPHVLLSVHLLLNMLEVCIPSWWFYNIRGTLISLLGPQYCFLRLPQTLLGTQVTSVSELVAVSLDTASECSERQNMNHWMYPSSIQYWTCVWLLSHFHQCINFWRFPLSLATQLSL